MRLPFGLNGWSSLYSAQWRQLELRNIHNNEPNMVKVDYNIVFIENLVIQCT